MDARAVEIERLNARIAALEVYKRAFEAAPIGLSLGSRDGGFTDINASALRLLGMRREEVIGRRPSDLGLHEPPSPAIPPDERAPPSPAPQTIRTRSGEIHEVTVLVEPVELQRESGFLSAFLDGALQSRARELHLASEARYRSIIEATHVGICCWDAQGQCTFVSRSFDAMFGYEPGMMLARHQLELRAAESRAQAEPLLIRRTEGATEIGEFKSRTREGQDMWLSFESSPVVGEDGAHAGVVATITDVTARRTLEESLRKREIQLRQAEEVAHVGSWEWDLRTNVVTRSEELTRILGSALATPGTGVPVSYDHVHPDDRARVHAEIERSLATHEAYAADYRLNRPDDVLFMHSRGLVVCDDAGTPVRMLGTSQDVTERKQAEARLLLTNRMASVGTLAAGVAHEINNPLTYVLANLDLVAEELREKGKASPLEGLHGLLELVAEARQGGERIRKIVRGLKAFSRADEERRVLLDVRRVLDGAITMANHEILHRARVVRDYHDVAPIEADEGRLAQVFINMLVNAAQCIPEGQADRNEILVATRSAADGRVLIEIRDTGPGMSPEIRARIFDPFFTTKPVGFGTGLGLSICHGIIGALGGEIAVESELGKGTLFRIALPAARLPEVTPEAPGVLEAPLPKRARVLIVDDEAIVGTTLRRILKAHDVTVFIDARAARDSLASGARYDVIFCDLMMPEMTGMDLHAELSRTTPQQAERMIFLTGGTFTETATTFLESIPNERFDKPFDAKTMRAVVQRFLR